MTAPDNILARLAQLKGEGGADPLSETLAARPTDSAESGAPLASDASSAGASAAADAKLDELINRVNGLASDEPAPAAPPRAAEPSPAAAPAAPAVPSSGPSVIPGVHDVVEGEEEVPFTPVEPTTFRNAGVSESAVEALILKYLLSCGECAGRGIADQVKLPFLMIQSMLAQMKYDQLVAFKDSAPMNDYVYILTDMGRERARRFSQICTYFGAAPVSLKDYIAAVAAQSITKQHPTEADLKEAFSDLLINEKMFKRLGPAVNSGRGMFLFGKPGNGKTSIAERVTKAFGECIWIPRAIGIDGAIMRLFDPANHEEEPLEKGEGLLDQQKIDKRWVRIRRPTIVVGGELTMDNLEVLTDTESNISEAPLQLKSNCGTLVIDDFGRQRMSTDELLNRWIVPLEKRYDFLNLPGGKKIQVPFDQLIVFSTNLEPKDLVDDAFLRRIPYKIEVIDPSEEEYRELCKIMAKIVGIPYNQEAIDYLVETHYKAVNRPFRCCQPRDLLLQIRNYCYYCATKPEMTKETMDFAVENYFAVM